MLHSIEGINNKRTNQFVAFSVGQVARLISMGYGIEGTFNKWGLYT
jgi:hypothetical protein